MKQLSFKKLSFFLFMTFAIYGCIDSEENIIGTWQMQGSTKYGIEFTNYGIAIWKHSPYMNTDLDYTYAGSKLIVSGVTGKATFSNDGKTITITGFSDISSFGTEGSTGPYINGVYIRQ